MIHSVRPELKLFALVDFDPHGVAIMRTYKYGSRRLGHENATIPSLRWLGIRSDDILNAADSDEGYGISLSQSSQDATSQESIAYSFDGKGCIVLCAVHCLKKLLRLSDRETGKKGEDQQDEHA